MPECVFCDKFRDAHSPECASSRESYDAILIETPNFVVVPALGQLVEGYLLIVTKEHFFSMGALSRTLFDEFVALKERVKDLLARTYKVPMFFEHGSNAHHFSAGCCINHAHIHAVPAGVDIVQDVRAHFEGNQVPDCLELRKKGATGQPYLFVEDGLGRKFLFDAPLLPSQYFRKLLAVKLGIPHKWDWRYHPESENIAATITKLRHFLQASGSEERLARHGLPA